MIALPARLIIRYRWAVIAAWVALAALFVPRAAHVQHVLTVRGSAGRITESTRAANLIDAAFPSPFADYVAIVVRGPVRINNRRFLDVIDTLAAAAEREPFVRQVVSIRTVDDSTFTSADRRTTFLLAGLALEQTGDITKDFVPEMRDSIRAALARVPGSTGFDVKITGTAALDHDVRTISAEDTADGERRILPLTLLVLVLAFGALAYSLYHFARKPLAGAN